MKTIHRLQNAKGILKKGRVTAQGLLIVKKEIGAFWKQFFMNKMKKGYVTSRGMPVSCW